MLKTFIRLLIQIPHIHPELHLPTHPPIHHPPRPRLPPLLSAPGRAARALGRPHHGAHSHLYSAGARARRFVGLGQAPSCPEDRSSFLQILLDKSCKEGRIVLDSAKVKQDILRSLHFKDGVNIHGSINRPNLKLLVRPRSTLQEDRLLLVSGLGAPLFCRDMAFLEESIPGPPFRGVY